MQSKAMSNHNQGQGWGLEFYDCVLNNNLAALETLVETHKIDLNAKFSEVRRKNHLDLSPIHLVAYRGFTGMLQYVYDMKCDIHLTTATLRRTALHFAVLRHKMACFHKLLLFGVNPDPRDTFGNSPCHYAAEDGACDILDVLITHNIDLNAQDITLKTPLMKATRNGKLEAVKRLLKAGANPNVRDKNRDSALHFAARHGSVELVNVLLEAKADYNIQNRWGNTPLTEAVSYNNKDATRRILAMNNTDVNIKEYKSSDTALHIAVKKNYTDLVDQLLSTQQVKHIYNYQGESAIYLSVVTPKIEVLKLFLRHNYPLEKQPAKLDYDGSGGKSLVKVATEKAHYELLKMFAELGFVINLPTDPSTGRGGMIGSAVLGGVGSVQAGSSGIFGGGGGGGAGGSSSGSGEGDTAAAVIVKYKACCASVRTLKQICRREIRNCLGYNIHNKLTDIHLPTCLKKYILLQELLAYSSSS